MPAKILKFIAALLISFVLGIGGSAADDSVLETLSGRTYYGVKVVKIDPNGVLFRHRDGAAKVTFDDMNPEIREYLGLDARKAAAFEKAHRPSKSRPASKKKAGVQPIDVVLTVRTTVRLPVTDHFARSRAACGGVPWFSHWARFHPGLAYAHFPCRQQAERDFLISSGILPTPPGVRVVRLPRR